MSNILQEYLVALGLKDKFSNKLQNVLSKSSSSVANFSKSFAKAGSFVGGVFVAANVGVAKFISNLVTADDEVTKFAKSIGKSRDEAFKIKTALDAMGKTMEEVTASPELTKTFEKLQRDADKLKPPDFSEGLNQVREIGIEFTRLKQAGTYAVQWVGHYIVKYLQQPMQKFKETFGGINDGIMKNIPKWADKAAWFMSGIVKLGTTLIRGAGAVFNAIKKIFDMIPKEIKIAGAALAGLALFIRAGPLGKLITIFSLLMLLVEDFFVFLDGGDSLLGGFWQKLIDIWNVLNKQGGVVENLKKKFEKAMEAISRAIDNAIGWVRTLWNQLKESDAINNFGEAFEKVGTAIDKIFQAAKDTLTTLFGSFVDGTDSVTPFLVWLISEALPGAIGLIADIAGAIASAASWFMKLDGAKEVILGIAGVILGVITAMKLWAIAQGILNAVMAINPIFLIIAAITALIAIGYLLIKNWDKVKEAFTKIWEKIKEIWGKIADWFKENVIDPIVNFFTGIKDKIVSVFTEIIDWVKENWKTIILFILNPIAGVFKYLYDHFEGFRTFVDGVVNAVKDFFTGLWDNIVNGVKTAIDKIIDFFQPFIDAIKKIFGGIIDFFKGVFKGDWESAWDGIKNIFGGIADWFKDIINKIIGFFEPFLGAFKLIFGGIIDFFTGIFTGDFDKAVQGIKNIFGGIADYFKAVIDKVIGFFQPLLDVFGKVADFVGGALSKVGDFVGGIGNKVGDFFGGLFGGDDKKDDNDKSKSGGKRQGHADGGIFTKEHDARFAEGDKPEAVIPLTKPKRAKEILSGVADYMGESADIPAAVSSNSSKDPANDAAATLKKYITLFDSIAEGIKSIFTSLVGFTSNILGEINSFAAKFNTGDNKSEYKTPEHSDSDIFTNHSMEKVPESRKKENGLPQGFTVAAAALKTINSAIISGFTMVNDRLSQKSEQGNFNNLQNIVTGINALINSSTAIYTTLSKMDVTLKQGSSVVNNHVTNNNSTVNHYSFDMPSSYTIHDTSGRPEATANAVDRTMQIKIRNLRGILNT